jgi:polar amino acid transport system substrate-binding protein
MATLSSFAKVLDTAIKERINAAIKALRENGKYDEITKKYFDIDIYGG